MSNYISLTAWPPGLLKNLNFHLIQLGHLVLQCLWHSYIVLQKISLQTETQGLNCVGCEAKIKLWRPKEATVWCHWLPRAGIPGSFRNASKLHMHALSITLFVPRSVSPWPVTSQILGHKSQCYFITKPRRRQNSVLSLFCCQPLLPQQPATCHSQITWLSSTQWRMPICRDFACWRL